MCNNNCDESFTVHVSRYGGPKTPHPKFVAYCKEEFEKANNPRWFGSKILIHYLVDERNQRYGTLISYKDGNAVRFGWSVCQTALDKWDKYIGFHYAFKRSNENLKRIPAYLVDEFEDFIARSTKYFKVDPKNFLSNLGTPVPVTE